MRLPVMQTYLRETFRRAGHYLAEWCQPAQVQRLLEEQLTGRADRYRQISALLTLMLWFEQAADLRAGSNSLAAETGELAHAR